MRMRGSALIESLVVMTVFAVGSAATGAWFVQSMAQGARASRMMAATVIAVSLEARLRANRFAAIEGHYAGRTSAAPDCARGCNARELASDDMIRFRAALHERVGEDATGEVRCGRDGRCVIGIRWRKHESVTWQLVL